MAYIAQDYIQAGVILFYQSMTQTTQGSLTYLGCGQEGLLFKEVAFPRIVNPGEGDEQEQ
jgi:hypothetical protein